MKILIAVGKEETSRKDVQDALRCKNSVEAALRNKGFTVEALHVSADDFCRPETIRAALLEKKPDCVFNLFEGFGGNSQSEAGFAEILEATAIPHTGNSARTLRLCLSKSQTKQMLGDNGVSVPAGFFIKHGDPLPCDALPCPLFIKPCYEDASVGIDNASLVTDRQDLPGALAKKLKDFPEGIIAEEFMPGIEYNVGMLGTFPFEILGISVMDYSLHSGMAPFMTYAAKWDDESPEFKALLPSLERAIDEALKTAITGCAVKAGRALGCRGYFRVDMREKGGRVFVIDVNPNPDINVDSGLIRQAYHKGYSYAEVLEKIIQAAITGEGPAGDIEI